ncbi:MAG: efflux RND transporter periplasmic adaptor subunit [Chthoniobacterales bacterium]|nr:efflux RND transporter periplasmic adaptor subunit [Chthoniobacterales bacterium]
MRRRVVVAVMLIVPALGLRTFYLINRGPIDAPVAKEQIVHAEKRKVGAVVNATGIIRLRVGSEVRVGAQLSGIVKKLNVTVGSHVEKGKVIAEIDDRTIQARLADAEAQAEMDRTSMERARVNYERSHLLAAKKVVAAQEEEDLSLAWQETKAKYEKSLRDCDLVRVDLSYVTIRAPIGGTIASVSTQEGETVAASFTAPTFVTIIADHALQLVAMVDETDIATVRPDNSVTFTVEALPSRDFPGEVERVAPKATIVSGVVNYEVTIGIEADAEALKPDMTANVSIQSAQHSALLLPASAVQRDGDQMFVYVAGKSGRERRSVALGTKENGMVEIRKGVALDDNILLPTAPTPESKNKS